VPVKVSKRRNHNNIINGKPIRKFFFDAANLYFDERRVNETAKEAPRSKGKALRQNTTMPQPLIIFST